MTQTMTMRERMLAVIRGEQPDRVPFVQYENLAAPDQAVWDVIGRGSMGVMRWTRVHRLEHPNCSTRTEDFSRGELQGRRTFIETPRGTLVGERLLEPTYGTGAAHKHLITQPEDYDVLLAYLEDSVVVADRSAFDRACVELGDDGLPLVAVERTPYQQLWVQWVSIADLSLHLIDCPDRVAACLQALARQEREICRLAAAMPVDFVDFPDNITAPMIGAEKFRQYCVPLYDELAGMLGERPVFVHMDGDLQPLWEAIGASGVRGIDSLAPPPDNDTSAGQAASLWPETRLWVNYPSSVHLAEPRVIYDQAAEILQQAGHTGRLQIQISENVPPGGWRKSYPEIVRAIRDFGKP
jgi:uroporphyrinogen decarboxylase-like protein